MSDKTRLFFNILKAELEALTDDLACSGGQCRAKMERQEIGTCLYQENEALLTQEACGIVVILNQLDDLDPDNLGSIDNLVEKVRGMVRELTKNHEYPAAVLPLINAKVEKIRAYVNQ